MTVSDRVDEALPMIEAEVLALMRRLASEQDCYDPVTGYLAAVNRSRNASCEGSIVHSVRDEFPL